jgi:hypothetical protein
MFKDYNQSTLNAFIYANQIPPNLSSCTTLSSNEVNNKVSNAQFLQPDGSYCWKTPNTLIPFECMGGYTYNRSNDTCDPPKGSSLPSYNWRALKGYNQSNLDAFISANHIPPNLSSCTTLSSNEVNNKVSNAKSRKGSFTRAECDILWPDLNVDTHTNYDTGDKYCYSPYTNDCFPMQVLDLNNDKCRLW